MAVDGIKCVGVWIVAIAFLAVLVLCGRWVGPRLPPGP